MAPQQARPRLKQLRSTNPAAQLYDAQCDLARKYGFTSWRALKAHIDALTVEGGLFRQRRTATCGTLSTLLDANPGELHARARPYEWSLLQRRRGISRWWASC